MSDDYFKVNRKSQIFYWGFGEMARGAGYAAVAVLGVALTIWVIYGIGLLLPAESRETPAPMGAIEMPVLTDLA